MFVAHENHAGRNAELGEHRGVVATAARHFERLIEQRQEPGTQSGIHEGRRRIASRPQVDVHAVFVADTRCHGLRLAGNRRHGRFGKTAHVEYEMRLAGNLAGTVERGVGVEFARGEDQVRARRFLAQPDRLHVVQEGDRGRHCIVAIRSRNSAGVSILPDAACAAKTLATAQPRHHGGRQAARDQRRALLDVQLEIRADARGIQQSPPFPDRLRIEAARRQCRLETAAVVRARDGQAARVEQSEGSGAAQVRDVEPRGFLGANRQHGNIAGRHEPRLAQARQRAQAAHHSGRTVVIAALGHAVEMRSDDDARRGAIPTRQGHRQIADRVDRRLEIQRARGRPDDVVRGLLAVAVAVAHDAATDAGRKAQVLEEPSSQVHVGFYRIEHRHILASATARTSSVAGASRSMSSLLAGKITVVTGASSGIGRAIATSFASEGAVVVLADVTAEPIEGGAPSLELITRAGGSAFFERTDVGCWRDVDALIGNTVARHGRVDVMVNNAAIYSGTALLDTEPEQWDEVLRVNLKGLFYGCKRAIAQMLTQEPRHEVRGRLINLGSQHGIVCCPGDAPYGVSKAGAIYLTRQIAVDYAKHLIVCNSISPGKIVTGASGLAVDPARLDNARRRTPWPRLGRPEDVANAAVFLASDRATYMTGANLVVDGGWLAG